MAVSSDIVSFYITTKVVELKQQLIMLKLPLYTYMQIQQHFSKFYLSFFLMEKEKSGLMFDDGSSLTLVDESIVYALDLEGEEQPLCLKWTNGLERREESSKIVCLNVSQSLRSQSYKLRDVRTIKNLQLPIPTQSVDIESLSTTHYHLKDVQMQSLKDAKPLLLIGLNHSKLMEVQRYKFGKDDELAAAKTRLGWCLFGTKNMKSGAALHIQHCSFDEKLDRRLEDIWFPKTLHWKQLESAIHLHFHKLNRRKWLWIY